MNLKNIKADHIEIGQHTIVEPTASIRGLQGNAKKIVIGDNVYIGDSVQIICDDFFIGDYSKIHHHTNIHGDKPCYIGHNAWIGQYVIIDSLGTVTIGNNCCVSANTHLWSHIRFGDTLEGCRFLREKALIIGDDVWFGGHCSITPIVAENKSMALAGSVVTKDMKYNHIYAGNPAKNISDKLGYQYQDIPLEIKVKKLSQYLIDSQIDQQKIKIVTSASEINFEDDMSYFNVATREYRKMRSKEEIAFMKFLLPARAKFIPMK